MMKLKRAMAGIGVLAAMGLGAVAMLAADAPATQPAKPATASRPAAQPDKPSPKMKGDEPDPGFIKHHEALVALAKKGDIDLYFEGDSITDNWHSAGKAVWAREIAGWKAGNFGIGGDRTEHVLWRLDHGELDGVKPKVFVLMIGTNNFNRGGGTNAQIVAGNAAIIKKMEAADPEAKILLLGIFPRWISRKDTKLLSRVQEVNLGLAKLDDGKNVKYMDIGDKFLTKDGELNTELMPLGLHPNAQGYEVWAAAIKPVLTQWLGAPAKQNP